MALKQKDVTAWGVLGAVAGVGTGFLLETVSKLASMIPGVSVDLQSISVQTSGLTDVVNTGLSDKISLYAGKLLGALPVGLTGMEWLYIALGGALFTIIGAYIADMLGFLKGSKLQKVMAVMIIGGVIVGYVLGNGINLAFESIVIMVVNVAILSYIVVTLDDMLNLKLVP